MARIAQMLWYNITSPRYQCQTPPADAPSLGKRGSGPQAEARKSAKKIFFFEKKKQKTFSHSGKGCREAEASDRLQKQTEAVSQAASHPRLMQEHAERPR
jgi:hypothetical protein